MHTIIDLVHGHLCLQYLGNNTVFPFLNSQGELEVFRCNAMFQLREGKGFVWVQQIFPRLRRYIIIMLIIHEEFINENKLILYDAISGEKNFIVKINRASSVERATAAICNGVLYLVGIKSEGTWTSQVYRIPLNELMSKESRYKTVLSLGVHLNLKS